MNLSVRGGQNYEYRGLNGAKVAFNDPMPRLLNRAWSHSGKFVDFESSIGIPAALAAIRLLSETLASLPLEVHRRDPEIGTRVVLDAPQAVLLSERPNEHCTAFDLWQYVMTSLQGYGNAFLLKLKTPRRGLIGFDTLDPCRVEVICNSGQLVYRVREDGKRVDLTSQDVLHIPGILLRNPYVGVSPITAAREAMGNALGQQEYQGRFYSNDATPPVIVSTDLPMTPEQQNEFRNSWNQTHEGSRNAHRMGILPNGLKADVLGLSLQDAQFVESQRLGVQEMGRIFRVPSGLLGDTDAPASDSPEQENMRFLTYSLNTWLRRIEQRVHADDDVFPDKSLVPRFNVGILLRADIQARSDGYLKARQAGWKTANDIRKEEGLPPIDGGDVLQETPVGGAPSLQPTK